MKPIIAIDRLKVLRRQYEHYDIALYETDLKVANFPKEKKLQLTSNIDPNEL
jgi:hypothetical protein